MLQHTSRQLVDSLSRHSNIMSRQTLRRTPEGTLELYHNIKSIVATKKSSTKDKKIVATFKFSIATKNNENGTKRMSRHRS